MRVAIGIQVFWRDYLSCERLQPGTRRPASAAACFYRGHLVRYRELPLSQFLLVLGTFASSFGRAFCAYRDSSSVCCRPHPDRLGGLGFLGGTVYAFNSACGGARRAATGPFAIVSSIWPPSLPEFRFEIAGVLLFRAVPVFGPRLVFAPQLGATRLKESREYDHIGPSRRALVRHKWLRGGATPDEAFLGSGDIQSLTDLATASIIVRTMTHAESQPPTVTSIGPCNARSQIVPLALTLCPSRSCSKTMFGLLF